MKNDISGKAVAQSCLQVHCYTDITNEDIVVHISYNMRCKSTAVQNHACSVVYFFKEKIIKYANVQASPDPPFPYVRAC